MNRFITVLLAVTAALTLSAAAHANAAFPANARDIPETSPHIPEAYTQQGQFVRLDYDTWESFTHGEHSQRLTKTAWVYLPYGYSHGERYNIFYYMHGGWSSETSILGTDVQPTSFKQAIAHAIQDRQMQPMIIVFPTFNNTSGEDSGNRYSKRGFMKAWQHTRSVRQQMSIEDLDKLSADALDAQGLRRDETDQISSIDLDQFMEGLNERDQQILKLRMQSKALEETAPQVGYSAAGSVHKRLQQIAEAYQKR